MTSKSKAKGGAWERDVAKFLSETYSAPFMRVPNSGAYTGGSNAGRKILMSDGQIRHMKGDIVPPDEWNHFNCECKNYADFPFHALLTEGPIPILDAWLEQILDASDPGDINILFFKITRKGKFVAFEKDVFEPIGNFSEYQNKDGKKWIVMGFDAFFAYNKQKFADVHE